MSLYKVCCTSRYLSLPHNPPPHRERERERDLKVTGEIAKEESTESDIKDPARPELAPRYFVVVSARVSG